MFQIYSVPDYNKYTVDGLPTAKGYPTIKAKLFESSTIKDIYIELKNDKQYHERLKADQQLKLNIDLDGFELDTFIETFPIWFKEEFDIDIDEFDFKYTQNQSKDNSHHVVIPKFYGLSSTLKVIMNAYKNKYEYSTAVDVGHLGVGKSGKWFRLPSQTKEGAKGTEHIIKRGKMSMFVLSYLGESTINLDEIEAIKKLIAPLPKPKFQLFDDCDDFVVSKPKKTIQKQKVEASITETSDFEVPDDIRKCFECMKPLRADTYEYWLNVGFVLFNELGDNGFNIWREWSKQSSKYDEQVIKNKWGGFQKSNLTIATLKMYAKEDNIDKYIELFKIDFDFNHFSTGYIADHFKSLYSDKFVYNNSKLYNFNGIYWKTDDLNLTIINNFVDKTYYNLIYNIFQKFDRDNKDIIDTKTICKHRSNIDKLRDHKKRETFIKEIICKITNNDIKFDEDPNLFAFTNKIYNLKIGSFVDPNPLDYISLTTGYPFNDDYDFDKKKEVVNKLIDTIFPKADIKHLYLTILATGLSGQTLEKFNLATGTGGNGKGLINEFAQFTLGNYAYVLPSNVLLGPLKTGSNPEVANMNNKRLVFCREPDSNYTINCATMKEITGGGEINARLNHSNDTKTRLKLTLIMECNDMPKLNEVNDATNRRVVVIPFEGQAVDKDVYDRLPKDKRKNIFIKNEYYKTTEFKEEYKQAFFLLLAEKYREYIKTNQLPIPDEVRKKNVDYMATSDNIFDWVDEFYEAVEGESVKLKDIYHRFTNGDYYRNLSKNLKRQYNYKYFVNKLETNFFLKNNVATVKKVMVLKGYKAKDDVGFVDDKADEVDFEALDAGITDD